MRVRGAGAGKRAGRSPIIVGQAKNIVLAPARNEAVELSLAPTGRAAGGHAIEMYIAGAVARAVATAGARGGTPQCQSSAARAGGAGVSRQLGSTGVVAFPKGWWERQPVITVGGVACARTLAVTDR